MNTCQALLDIFAQKCLTGVQFWENAKSTISGLKKLHYVSVILHYFAKVQNM